MSRILPVVMFLVAVCGLVCAFIGLMLAIMSHGVSHMGIACVLVLFISCVINAVSLVQGILFKSKLCLTAMIMSIVSYTATIIGFIILYAA